MEWLTLSIELVGGHSREKNMKLAAFLVPISLAAVTVDLRLCTDTSTVHGSLPNAIGKQGALSVTLESSGSEGLVEMPNFRTF